MTAEQSVFISTKLWPFTNRFSSWHRLTALSFSDSLTLGGDLALRILVTGAAGFIGQMVVSALSARDTLLLNGTERRIAAILATDIAEAPLADLAALAGLLAEARNAGQDIGAPALLARYSRARLPDMAARIAGVDALNRASMASAAPLHDLRRQGLKLLHGVKPLRKAAMFAGLGAGARQAP